MKKKPNILTQRQRTYIKNTRDRAIRNQSGKVVGVAAYTRHWYRLLPASEAAALAQWERAEAAIFAVCSARDRRRAFRFDKEAARRTVKLLRDTFGI